MTSREGRGWYAEAARMIAKDLVRDARAEVVGAKSLRGLSPSYVELDGVPVAWPLPPRKEAPGVRTTLPSGYVALYLTLTHERAQELLRQARELAGLARPEGALPDSGVVDGEGA